MMKFQSIFKMNTRKSVVALQLVAVLSFSLAQFGLAKPAEARFSKYSDSVKCVNAPTKPTLNYWPVTFNDYDTPTCHDFPAIDAALDDGALGFSFSQSDWNDGLQLDIGQRGVALIYVHNGASNQIDRAQTQAKNVRVVTSTSNSTGSLHTLAVTLTGDNTNTIRQSFTVHTPENSRLEVIPNSGFMYARDGTPILDQQKLDLGNSTYTIGNIDACFEYSVFLTYKFKVVADHTVDSGSAQIERSKDAFNDTQGVDATAVAAQRGDYITYKLRATNYGNSSRGNYVIKDDLSQVLPYADIIDLGGGRLSGDSVVYPAVDIRADQTITRYIRVRVKSTLAKNRSYRLVNEYGNRININVESLEVYEPPVPPVEPPVPPVVPKSVYHAPRTGSAMVSGLVFALFFTLGFAVIRQRRQIWHFIIA